MMILEKRCTFLLIFFFLFLSPTIFAEATKLDSLLRQQHGLSEIELIDSLISEGKIAKRNVKYKEGEHYAWKAYELSKKTTFYDRTVEAVILWVSLSKGGALNSNLEIETLLTELSLAEQRQNKKQQATLLNAIAVIHYRLKEHSKMAEALLKAINIYNDISSVNEPFHIEKARIYVNLGINVNGVDMVKSKVYFQKAVEYALKSKNLPIIQLSTINLGTSCINLGQHDEGLGILNKLLTDYPNLSNSNKIIAYMALGEGYTKTQKPIPAEYYLQTALELAKESPTTTNYIITYLSKLYYLEKKYEKAIEFALRPLPDYIESNTLIIIAETYDVLHNSYAEINDFQNAYDYHQKYSETIDSIASRQRKDELLKLSTEFETIQKDQEIRLLSQKNKINNLFLVMLFIVLISLAGLSKLYYNKWKLTQALKKEKEKRHQEILNAKERTLARISLTNQQKNEHLVQIKNKVENLASKKSYTGKEFDALLRELGNASNSDTGIQQFLIHFEKVHPGFFDNLRSASLKLTTLDLKHCAFIKLNLDTKDIANMLRVDPKSVQMARYRIKKKIGLNKENSLSNFLSSI